jgi:hypothetical protein
LVAVVAVADCVSEGVGDGVSVGVGDGVSVCVVEGSSVVAVAPTFADRVAVGVVPLDVIAQPTKTVVTATRPTKPAVDTREETFSRPTSAAQGAHDGRHRRDYLLCHGGEHFVIPPERIDNIGLFRLERGFEAPTRCSFLGNLTNPYPRIHVGGAGGEAIDPCDEIGEVAEREHLAQGLRIHRRHLATVRPGRGEDQIGPGNKLRGEVSGRESGRVAAVCNQLGCCLRVHGPPGHGAGAGAAHLDGPVRCWPVLVQTALQESLDEG